MDKKKLAQLIAAMPKTYTINPFWEMNDGYIWDKQKQIRFSPESLKPWLSAVVSFFRLNYDSFRSESQVLLVTEADKKKLESKYAIPSLQGTNFLVLPQVNTWSNTSISEIFWQNVIMKEHITPLMRIHSHHVLEAYQSNTDWSTLNSGTLEVVLGKIYDEVPEIAYWLDIRGTENKDNVFKSIDLGKTENKISSGKLPKMPKWSQTI